MLRITTQDNPRILTLRVEGRLIGPWAVELEKCWRSMLASASGAMVRVDLNGVTFVDATGKAVIAAMHERGAQLIANDCQTCALIEEITKTRSST